MRCNVCLLAMLAMRVTFSQAAITYIDALPGVNTMLADGTAMAAGTHDIEDNPIADDKWDLRTFANGGTIISSNNAVPSTASA